MDNNMTKRLIRNAFLAFGALVVGGTIEVSPEKIDDSTGNSPYEVCELGGDNGNFNPRAEDVTIRDVYCKRVILPDGRLIVPKRVKSFQDYCISEFMQRNKDGKCEYFPPKYFEI